MKKVIALVLALVLCLTMFTGCKDSSGDDSSVDTPVQGIDYAAAFAKHDPNTVVMTINGEEITWSEFYYTLSYAVSQLQYYLGEMEWDQECVEGTGVSFGEYAMQLTMDSLRQFHSISTKAEEMDIVLTDGDMATITATENAFKLQSCGEGASDEEFAKHLLENYYMTEEVYQYINRNAILYEKLFVETVGQNGEKLTDEDIAEYVKTTPYVTAKHILIKTRDSEYNDLPQEQIDAAKKQAADILSQLVVINDPVKLEAKFDELMGQYNQDEGTMLFTQGYTFTTGEMMPEFETAAFELEEYELSGVVKTEVGYHIILRLPTTRNHMVDYDYETGSMYTVVYYAATSTFSKLLSAWVEECDVVWNTEFDGITPADIFA